MTTEKAGDKSTCPDSFYFLTLLNYPKAPYHLRNNKRHVLKYNNPDGNETGETLLED